MMKRIDCVEMMHRGAKRIYVATKDMTRKAELEYWQAKARELLPHASLSGRSVTVVREDRACYRVKR